MPNPLSLRNNEQEINKIYLNKLGKLINESKKKFGYLIFSRNLWNDYAKVGNLNNYELLLFDYLIFL